MRAHMCSQEFSDTESTTTLLGASLGLLQETLEEHPVVVTDGEELRVVQLPPGHHPQPLVEAFKVGGIDYSVLVVVEEVLEEVSELLHLEGGEEAADLGPVHVPLRPLGHK